MNDEMLQFLHSGTNRCTENVINSVQLGPSQPYAGGVDFLGGGGGGGGSSGALGGMNDIFGLQSSATFVPAQEVFVFILNCNILCALGKYLQLTIFE